MFVVGLRHVSWSVLMCMRCNEDVALGFVEIVRVLIICKVTQVSGIPSCDYSRWDVERCVVWGGM